MTIDVKDAAGVTQTVGTLDDYFGGAGEITPENPLAVQLQTSAAQIGRVGGNTPRVTASMTRPSSATAYAISDAIGNHATTGTATPLEFTAARFSGGSGRITGASCVLEASSPTIVFPAFNLVLFRDVVDIPFAPANIPGDNTLLNISTAAMREIVAVLSFSANGWMNRLGTNIANGPSAYQTATVNVRQYAPFSLDGLGTQKLIGLLHATNAWAPGAFDYIFDFVLDVDQD